jgi:hypothetical protein
MSWLSSVHLVQGIYYAVTGAWPLFSIRTFQVVTGPKTDLWLVRTVGILVLVIGAAILDGVCKPKSDQLILACGSAIGLTAIDVIYVHLRIISKIYLVDAVLQITFILLIGACSLKG